MHNHIRYATSITARAQRVQAILTNTANSWTAQELREIATYLRSNGRRVTASDYKAAAQHLERMGP